MGNVEIMRLLLTDSADAYAASRGYNSRHAAHTARLGMAYLLELLTCICIAYPSVPFDLADQGDKYPNGRPSAERAALDNSIVIGPPVSKDTNSTIH